MATDLLLNIAMQQLEQEAEVTVVVELARGAINTLTEIEAAHETAVAAINANAELTDTAKGARIGIEDDRAGRRVSQEEGGVLRRVSAMRATLQAATAPPAPPRDSLATEIRKLRRWWTLKDMDALQVSIEYTEAARRADDLTMWCIDDAAPYERQFAISADVRAQAEAIRREAVNPAASAQARELDRLELTLRGLFRTMQRKYGVADPVAAMARGEPLAAAA